jgi:hypothetical protein
VSNRNQRKALARWENDTRHWAHQTARNLVLSVVSDQATPATPYGIGDDTVVVRTYLRWPRRRTRRSRAHCSRPAPTGCGEGDPPQRAWIPSAEPEGDLSLG